MNRNLWTQGIQKGWCPPWPCPCCGRGVLSLVRDSLVYKETEASKSEHNDDGWDPTWIAYTFTAWASCSQPSCRQQFAIAGTGGVDDCYTGDGELEWQDKFHPKSCYPMPDVIAIPKGCPSAVSEELRAAFAMFWAHRGACAGRLRIALECLMTFLGIPKRRKGRRSELSLHNRIDAFATREPAIGCQLMALKWLGNTASHGGSVPQDELLDALEIFEHALAEIIEKRSKKVAALAKKLTKKHGRK